MHFARIPDEPVESMAMCFIKTETAKPICRRSSSEASSEDNSSGDSEDERVQRLAKLQEQVVSCAAASVLIVNIPMICVDSDHLPNVALYTISLFFMFGRFFYSNNCIVLKCCYFFKKIFYWCDTVN